MDGIGKKRTLIIVTSVIIVTLCFIIIGFYCYDNYYKVDISQFHYTFLSRIVDSPDSKYQISISILKSSQNSEDSYIKGDLHLVSNQRDVPKTIFWQKVNSSDINNKWINGLWLDNWVDVVWLDKETVRINNITVDIFKDVYDYRRNW